MGKGLLSPAALDVLKRLHLERVTLIDTFLRMVRDDGGDLLVPPEIAKDLKDLHGCLPDYEFIERGYEDATVIGRTYIDLVTEGRHKAIALRTIEHLVSCGFYVHIERYAHSAYAVRWVGEKSEAPTLRLIRSRSLGTRTARAGSTSPF